MLVMCSVLYSSEAVIMTTYIEKTEHSSPATRRGLSKMWELMEIVLSENGIHRQLDTERAEVTGSADENLWGGEDTSHILECWLLHNFTLGGLNHGLF